MKKIMKLKTIAIAVLSVSVLFLNGCNKVDDFLGAEPSKNSNKTIETAEQLDGILANYSKFYEDNTDMVWACDDFGFLESVQRYYSSGYGTAQLINGLWADDNTVDARYNTWMKEYPRVYFANLVLNYIDQVSGDEAYKANLKAEAHFVRAYCMFQLALAHTLYYDGSNGDELGLTLKSSISFEESAARASLKETWDFIDADVQESLKITKKYKNSDGMRQTWRGTTASVNAFAARYYLYRGDYTKAKDYAEKALTEYGDLLDFNTEMYFDESQSEPYVINAGTPKEETIVIKFPWTKPQGNIAKNVIEWKEMLYARTGYNGYWWFIPSEDLMNVFKKDAPNGDPDNDLRYHYFMHLDFGVRFAEKTDNGRIPGYCQFFYQGIVSGPSTAEMNLIIAECLAREGNASGAMTYVNKLRKTRIATAAYKDLTASSADDAVKKVLDERRREMPFVIRWYDLKRLNALDPANKVTVVRKFYKYTTTSVLMNDGLVEYKLEPNSRHYALPINNDEINNSDGVLQQNTY